MGITQRANDHDRSLGGQNIQQPKISSFTPSFISRAISMAEGDFDARRLVENDMALTLTAEKVLI